MNKLELAHDFVMKELVNVNGWGGIDNLIEASWGYADAMQAENNKRIDKSLPDVLTGDDIDRVVRAFKPLK